MSNILKHIKIFIWVVMTLLVFFISFFLFFKIVCPGMWVTLVEVFDFNLESVSMLNMLNDQNAIYVVEPYTISELDVELSMGFVILGAHAAIVLAHFGIPLDALIYIPLYGLAISSTAMLSATDSAIKYPNLVGGGAQTIAASVALVCAPMLGGPVIQMRSVPLFITGVNSFISNFSVYLKDPPLWSINLFGFSTGLLLKCIFSPGGGGPGGGGPRVVVDRIVLIPRVRDLINMFD